VHRSIRTGLVMPYPLASPSILPSTTGLAHARLGAHPARPGRSFRFARPEPLVPTGTVLPIMTWTECSVEIPAENNGAQREAATAHGGRRRYALRTTLLAAASGPAAARGACAC
jgi:hypothetical protein